MTSTPDSSLQDRELVRRFQAGDEGAFDRLVQEHQREVYRLAFRLLGNHADADDLAQEAFLRAYRSLTRFRGDSTFRTWLTRIVLNLAADRRQERRMRKQLALDDMSAREHPVLRSDPEGAILGREVLATAVRELPPRQRQTLILRVCQEMKFQEIAVVMGCSVGTAKANFFHALRGLRRKVRR
jgi:RNA polymerase sigma-70 factor (ECF subfamily)